MTKKTQNLSDGKLKGSFPGLAAVMLSFGLAFAAFAAGGMVLAGCDNMAGSGSSDESLFSAYADSEEESALALNKGGKNGKGKGKGPAGWIPRKESALVDLQAVWSQTLSDTAKQEAFGWPADECVVVTDAIDAFTAAREAYKADKTKENRSAKDEAKKASVKAMLDFAKARVFGNELLTQEDKESLGLKPRDKDRDKPPRDKQPRDKNAPEAGESIA